MYTTSHIIQTVSSTRDTVDNMSDKKEECLPECLGLSTRAIHAGVQPEEAKGRPLVPPITLSTTFEKSDPEENEGFSYTRSSNPSRESLEKGLAAIHGSKYALCTSSGMAAAHLIKDLLVPGDHVVTMSHLYHGVLTMFKRLAECGFAVTFVDASESQNVKEALRPNTKMIWLESPTNPSMKLVDLKAISSLVKESAEVIVVCDNTFMGPCFQRPLALGLDIVMESCTKYINGHSDVLMGAIFTNNEDLFRELYRLQTNYGPTASSFDCYLVSRSLKTLEIRMQRHMENALAVAKFLETHAAVEKVLHPGLPSHPQHELALRQCSGYSGVFSFYLKGHDLDFSTEFIKNLKLFYLSTSLGGCESTVKLPSRMPAHSLPEHELAGLGITDNLIRLSVGLENKEDLVADLQQALMAAVKKECRT